ncbi:hypothetical protein MBM_04635 [Drepanopeziza brunnea f. sp. 'multigermtubi' MB_m1]|uniref:Uncharacterized protein n=1 Tax=Marssonina brunnea f. sp. multigermtubi (strain MB_m1) TaxID=1072389 RepID=K1X8N8_MARBU|nr:uncharacterized protein MBM_04635 [Drepanopeziza brunnea f. sp. 'multigermtubi' MB_m1]EKD17058.1 hypothetical protein MBM_04635 [Drepanopeziza brunnea f. sp. 'multigermtubi' MB_m1]
MNWTGGRLQRHSTTTDSAAQRQREHFARVQQNLRNGGIPNKQSPLKALGIGPGHHRQRQHGQNSTPYAASSTYDRSQSIRRDNHKSTLDSAPPHQKHEAKNYSRFHEPRPSGPPLQIQIKREQNRVPDDDLYSATPPPRKVKRKREDLVSLSEFGSAAGENQVEESLSDKKRRILRQGDWLGIAIQRPLQLAFASPRDEQEIGKRRKLSNGHKAKYRPAHSRMVSPFAARKHPDYSPRIGVQEPRGTFPSIPDVRISIGGRAVQPGVSSSTVPRRKYNQSPVVKRSSRATSSSDIMLLDNESMRGYRLGRESKKALTQIPESPRPGRGQSSYQSYRQDVPLDVSDEQGWAGVTEESLANLQGIFQSNHAQHAQKIPPQPEVGFSTQFSNTLRPGKVAFSSSSTSIHHPVPQSSKRSVLIRSNSSQFTASNIAQVGVGRAVVSNSQLLENEIWRTWIAPEDSDDQPGEIESRDSPSGDGYISPGMSLPPPRPPSMSIPAEDAYSSELEEPYTGEVEEKEAEDELQKYYCEGTSACEGVEDNQSEHSHHEELFGQPLVEGEPELPARNATDEGVTCFIQGLQTTPLKIPRGPSMQPPLRLVEEDKSIDVNEAWRKFVLGSSSDEIEAPGFVMDANTASSEQDPIGSSLVAHAATERITGVQASDQSPSGASPGRPSISSGFPVTDNSSFLRNPSPWDSNLGSTSTHRFASTDEGAAVDAANASARNLSSEMAPSSRAVEESSAASRSVSSTAKAPTRKFIFTKPRPFIGRNSRTDVEVDDEFVHIGRGLRGGEEVVGSKTKENWLRDIHSIVASDERDELKSIEED